MLRGRAEAISAFIPENLHLFEHMLECAKPQIPFVRSCHLFINQGCDVKGQNEVEIEMNRYNFDQLKTEFRPEACSIGKFKYLK